MFLCWCNLCAIGWAWWLFLMSLLQMMPASSFWIPIAMILCLFTSCCYSDHVGIVCFSIFGVFYPTLLLLLWACLSFLDYLTHRSCNYGAIMSLCDFTAFLRIPFSESDFLHYLLKYVFEPYESLFMKSPLQKIPKKNRLRYQGSVIWICLCVVMERLSNPPENKNYKLVGIPVPIGCEVVI